MTGYDGNGYEIGDRVELHPGCDLWMRGARYGTVTGFPGKRPTRRIIGVTLDSGKHVYLDMERVRFVESRNVSTGVL